MAHHRIQKEDSDPGKAVQQVCIQRAAWNNMAMWEDGVGCGHQHSLCFSNLFILMVLENYFQ